MHSHDVETIATAVTWSEAGHGVALVTVARTWGSAPRPFGSLLALRSDGVVHGSVSGGCVEDDLIGRMRASEFSGRSPRVLRYGETADEAQRFGLPCGGSLELVVEPAPDFESLGDLLARMKMGDRGWRVFDLVSGLCTLASADTDIAAGWDGQLLVTAFGPRRRMLLIGAGQISRYLAQMAPALDYAVSVCEPREEYRESWNRELAPLVDGMPDDVVLAMRPDAATSIVALTHDPKLDDMALLEALKSPAFYVGALGSSRGNARRRERLLHHFDLTPEQVARLHGPVGLPIGSRTPPEIAVSILAEIVAVTQGVSPS